jgi:ribosomal protein S17
VLIVISGKYVDKKCPFTGNVSIRGRILSGVVKTTKMKRTIVIRRDYLHYITKYNRFEKRHSTLSAHCSPAFLVREGQKVVVGQCRYESILCHILFTCNQSLLPNLVFINPSFFLLFSFSI